MSLAAALLIAASAPGALADASVLTPAQPALAQPALAQPALAQPATAQPATADQDVIATRAVAENRMAVDVRLGDSGPYRFLVDTGAQNTVIGASLAQKLALKPGREAIVSSVAGKLSVPTVVLDEIVLGRRSYYGLLSPLLEERHIGADGIVGVDSLQGQRVLIDFRRHTLTIDDARGRDKSDGYEIVVTARRKSGQLIMTDARIEGVRTSVVIDTGADVSIGNPALQAALGKRGMQLVSATITSVTGQSVTAGIALVKQLQIQDITLSNFAIAFTDAPPFRSLGLEDKPAILLGMAELRMFNRMAIDFPGRRVMFDLPDEAVARDPWGSF